MTEKENKLPNRYNLRVYAIITNSKHEMLVSDEFHFGEHFTKFPGGGLEFGEGLSDALKREFMEEFHLKIDVKNIFYVNDYFQLSSFNENDQLLSFYYFATFDEVENFTTSKTPVDLKKEGESLRWVDIATFDVKKMRFPIDQLVAEKLKSFQW